MLNVSRETPVRRLRASLYIDVDVEVLDETQAGYVLRAIPGTEHLLSFEDLAYEAARRQAENFVERATGEKPEYPEGHVFWLGRAHARNLMEVVS